MKLTFTDKQYEMLEEKAEWFFRSAIEAHSLRSAPRYVTELIAQTYEDATGARLNRNYRCGACVMNIYLLVGKAFYKDKEERNKLREENEVNKTTNVHRSRDLSTGEAQGSREDSKQHGESRKNRSGDKGRETDAKKGNVGSKSKREAD